jgi:hypothetical protein
MELLTSFVPVVQRARRSGRWQNTQEIFRVFLHKRPNRMGWQMKTEGVAQDLKPGGHKSSQLVSTGENTFWYRARCSLYWTVPFRQDSLLYELLKRN